MRADRERDIKLWTWLLAVMLALIMLWGCTTTKYVPVNRVVRVTEQVTDTVVEVVTAGEKVVNVTRDTTSVISTSHATSTAEVRAGVLWHELVQHARKDSVAVQTKIVQITDSVPYAVEVTVEKSVVPAWSWWTLAVSGLSIGAVSMMIVGRIKRV